MDWLVLVKFIIKPIAIYIIALAVVRWMGKRALASLGLFDLVIMAGIGDIIVVVGLEQKVSFGHGLAMLGVLGGLELFFSMLAYHSRFVAWLLEGKPTLLVKDGEILEQNLAKEHISMDDLRQELRKQGVSDIRQVSHAVLEACGKFSVIFKEDESESIHILREIHALKQEVQDLRALMGSLKEK